MHYIAARTHPRNSWVHGVEKFSTSEVRSFSSTDKNANESRSRKWFSFLVPKSSPQFKSIFLIQTGKSALPVIMSLLLGQECLLTARTPLQNMSDYILR